MRPSRILDAIRWSPIVEIELISLFVIVVAAFLAPLVSAIVPKKMIPETVFLLIAGMVIGPNVLGIANTDAAISLLSDLGLGFLFLLAGYEIDPAELGGKQGRHGLYTWIVTFAIAMGICVAIPDFQENPMGWLAAAIALTTTAFGTLVPILHDRGLVGTRIGDAIFSYGTWGELCPIIVIALILSSRSTWVTLVILATFAAIAIATALIPKRIKSRFGAASDFIEKNRDTNAQILIRIVMVLLVGLVTVSAVFDLDIVLGAFAAGFVLRYVIPEGDKRLEGKLKSIGYGFFIPLFFIVSGMAINPVAVTEYPLLLVLFVIALLLVRALPIFFALRIFKETKYMDRFGRATIALYCTTALPLIVAITNIAVSTGTMSSDIASLLVAAGGITVFLMPLFASISLKHIHCTPADVEAGICKVVVIDGEEKIVPNTWKWKADE